MKSQRRRPLTVAVVVAALAVGVGQADAASSKKPKTTKRMTSTKPGTTVVSPGWPTPAQYVAALGVGLDVDWVKNNAGMSTYGSAVPAAFRARGLTHVRIRVTEDPSADLFAQLDTVITDTLNAGLIPVLAYQANAFKEDPSEANLAKSVAWWTAVSQRYANRSPRLSFDLIIEVTDALNKSQPQLNAYLERAVATIRETNPRRVVFISPRVRSDPQYLSELAIPTKGNGYLAAEWHFYAAGPVKSGDTKRWTTGTPEERRLITDKVALATTWSAKTKIPTWVGAWMPGNYNDGNDYSVDEQVVFATFVSCTLRAAKVPYAVNSDSKFYDRDANAWIASMAPVLEAVLHPTC